MGWRCKKPDLSSPTGSGLVLRAHTEGLVLILCLQENSFQIACLLGMMFVCLLPKLAPNEGPEVNWGGREGGALGGVWELGVQQQVWRLCHPPGGLTQ